MSLRATFVEDSLGAIAVSTPPPQRLRHLRDTENAEDAFATPPPFPLLQHTKRSTPSTASPTDNRAVSRARSNGGTIGVGGAAANDLTELYDNAGVEADDDYSLGGFGLLGIGSPSTPFTTERTKEVYGSIDPFDKILVSWEIVSDPRVVASWRLNFRRPEKDLIEKIVEAQRERKEKKDDAEDKDEEAIGEVHGGLVNSSVADRNESKGNGDAISSDLPLVELCVARLGPQKQPFSHVLEVGGVGHGTLGGGAQCTSACFVELAGQVLSVGVGSSNGLGASGLPPLCIPPIVLAPEEHNGTLMRLKDVLEDPSVTLAKENKKRADAQLQQQAPQQQQSATGGNGSAVALNRGVAGTSKNSTFNNSSIAGGESASSSHFIRSSSTINGSALLASNLASSAGQHNTTVVGPFSTASCKVGPGGSTMVAITLKEAEAKEEEDEEEEMKRKGGGSDVHSSLSEIRKACPLLAESSESIQQTVVVHTKAAPSRGSISPLRSTSITLLPPPQTLTPDLLADQTNSQPTESQLRAEGLVRSPERSPSSTKAASSPMAAGSGRSVARPVSPATKRMPQSTSSSNTKAGLGTKSLQPKSILPSSHKVVGRQNGGGGGAFALDGSPTGYDEDGNHVYVPDIRTAYLTETTLEPQSQSIPPNPQIASLTSAAASSALAAIYARIPPSAPLRSVSLLAARVAVAHALKRGESPTSPNTRRGTGTSPESAGNNQERSDTFPSSPNPNNKRRVFLPPLAAAAIGAVLPRGVAGNRCANAILEVPAAIGLCGGQGVEEWLPPVVDAQRASRYTEACYWGMGKAGGRWAILNPSQVQLHVSQKNNKGRGRAVVGSGGMGGLVRCSAVDPRVLLSPDEFHNNEEASVGAAGNIGREGSVVMSASTLPRPSAASNASRRSLSRPSIAGDRDKVDLQADGTFAFHNQNKMSSTACYTDPVNTIADASYYLRPGRSYGGLGGRGRSGTERDSEQGFGGCFGGLMAEVEALLANGVLGSEGLHSVGAKKVEESHGERGLAASNSHATPFLSLNNEPISSYSGGIGGAQVNSISNNTNLLLIGGASQSGGMGVLESRAIGVEPNYSERDGVGTEAYRNLQSRLLPLIENTLVPLSCTIDGPSQPHPTSNSAIGRPISPNRLGVGRGPATRLSSTSLTPAGGAASAARRRRGNSPSSHTNNVKDSHDDCGPLSVSVPIVPTVVNTKSTCMPLATGKALRQPLVTRVAHAQAEVGGGTATGGPQQQQTSSILRRGASTVAQAAGSSQGGGDAHLRPSSAKKGKASSSAVRPSSASTSHETQSAKEGKDRDKKNAGQGVTNLASSAIPLPTAPPLFTSPPKAPQVIRGEFPTDPRHAVAHFLSQPLEVTAACYASAAAEHYAYLLEKALLTGVPATVTSSSNLNMYVNFPRLCESAWDALLGIGCSQPDTNLSRPLPAVLRNYGFAPSWPLPLNPSLTSALSADATVANLMARPTTYTLTDLLGPSILNPETGAVQDLALSDQQNFTARPTAAGSTSSSAQYLHNKMEREREKERVAKELQIVAARTQFEQQYALLSNVAQYLFTFIVGDDHGVYVVVPGRECVSTTVPPKRKENARSSFVWSSEQEHSTTHAQMNGDNNEHLGLSDTVPLDATQTPEAAAVARNAKSRPASALGNRARSNSKNGGPTSLSVTKSKGAGSVFQQVQSNSASTTRRGGASPDDLHTSSLSGQGGSNVNPSLCSPEDPFAYTPYNEDHQQKYFIHVGGKFNSWGALAHTPLTPSDRRDACDTMRLKGLSSASERATTLIGAAAGESDHDDVSVFLSRGYRLGLLQDGKIRLLEDDNENQDEDLYDDNDGWSAFYSEGLSSGSPQFLGGLFKEIAMYNHEAMRSRYGEYHAPSTAKVAAANNNANTPWGARSFRKSVSMRTTGGEDNPDSVNGGGSGALRKVNSQGSSAADGLPQSSFMRAQPTTKAAAARTVSSVGRTTSAASNGGGGGEAQRTISTRTNQSTTSQQQTFSVSKEATSPFLLFPIPPPPIDPSDFTDLFGWGGGDDGSTFSGRQGVKTLDEQRYERNANIARSLLGMSTVLSVTSMAYTMYTHVALEPSVWQLMRQPGTIKQMLDGNLSRASVEHQLEEIATAVSFYRGADAALALRGKMTVGQEESAVSPSPLQLAGSSVLGTVEATAMQQKGQRVTPTREGASKPVRLPPAAIGMSTKAVVRHYMPSGYYYSGCVEHCERKRRACVHGLADTNSRPATGGSNQTSRPVTGSPQLAAGRLGTSVAHLSPNNLNYLLAAKGTSFSASASVFGGGGENLQNASTPCSPSRGRNRSVSRASFASTAAPGASPTRSGLSRDGGTDPFSNPATAAFLSSLLYDDAFPPLYFKDSERNSGMVSARGPAMPFAVHLQKAILEGVNDANVARKDILWRSGPMDYYRPLSETLYPPRKNDGKAVSRSSSTTSSRRASAFGGGATDSSDAGLRGGLRSLAAVANARWAASVAKNKPASSPTKKK